ncbi:MAG: PEP-CTERM sorting domain-containing protein [Pseudomonadota bacterium]
MSILIEILKLARSLLSILVNQEKTFQLNNENQNYSGVRPMKKIWIAGLLALFAAPLASAHTVSIGTENAGAAGSVTLWMGSYHGGAPNEGSMMLNGVTQAFNIATSTMPTALVDGTNNFYSLGNFGAGTTGQYDQNSWAGAASLVPVRWQGVTFTGLAAGTYAYTISGMNSVNWADWNSGLPNWSGTLVIPRSSVAPVSEPGFLALMGIGLAGLGLVSRRRKVAS